MNKNLHNINMYGGLGEVKCRYMKSIKGPRMQHESMKRYEDAYNVVLGLGGPFFLVAATGRSVIT